MGVLGMQVHGAYAVEAPQDTQRPTIKSAKYLDENPRDGKIDTIALLFSEKVKYATYATADWSVNPADIPGLAITGLRYATDDIIKFSVTVNGSITGPLSLSGKNPSISTASGGIPVLDLDGNRLQPFSSVTVEDGAAPFIDEAAVLDEDGDGRVDSLSFHITEPMDLGSITVADFKKYWKLTGSDFGASLVITEATISDSGRMNVIKFTEPAVVKTNLGNMRLTYAPGGIEYVDAGRNALAPGVVSDVIGDMYPVLKDSAAPVIVSTEPAQQAKNVPVTGKIVVIFSEPMNPGTVGATVLNNYKTTGPEWSQGNTVATWVYAAWPDNHALVFYITAGTAAQGSGGTNALMLMGGTLPYNLVFQTGASNTPPPIVNTKITNTSIAIDGGAAVTLSSNVTLSLTAEHATEMQVANSSNFSGLSWIPFASAKSWTFSAGTGNKKVCARFRNPGYTSGMVCDSITVKPAAKIATLEVFSINDDAPTTHNVNVTLTIKAKNAKSMRIRNDTNFSDEPWAGYTTKRAWVLPGGYGKKTVYMQFLSPDGLLSNVFTEEINYTAYIAPPPGVIDAKKEITSGGLIKLQDDGNPATKHDNVVYYYGSDGKRYAFSSEKVFFSWYATFAGMQVLTPGLMSSIPLGGTMQIRPGTYLIKSSAGPRVYVITPGGVLRPLKNEKAARKFFGDKWMSRVVTVSDADLLNYDTTSGKEVTEAGSHPEGTIIEAGGKKYYMGTSKLQTFTDTGFSENNFQGVFLVKLKEKPKYGVSGTITKKTTTHSKFQKKQKNGKVIAL